MYFSPKLFNTVEREGPKSAMKQTLRHLLWRHLSPWRGQSLLSWSVTPLQRWAQMEQRRWEGKERSEYSPSWLQVGRVWPRKTKSQRKSLPFHMWWLYGSVSKQGLPFYLLWLKIYFTAHIFVQSNITCLSPGRERKRLTGNTLLQRVLWRTWPIWLSLGAVHSTPLRNWTSFTVAGRWSVEVVQIKSMNLL